MSRVVGRKYSFVMALGILLAGVAVSLLAQVGAQPRPEPRSSLPTVGSGAAAFQQRSRESGANTAVSDAPKQLLSLTVWVVRLQEPVERGNDAAKAKLIERLNNLQAEFASLKEARDFVQELKTAGRVRSSRELRLISLDGQPTRIQRGADQPQITGSSQTNRGRSNAVMYRSTGTIIDALPRIDSEKRIQVQFDYNANELAKSNDVALTEDVDGKSQFADVIVSHMLKTTASLKNGGAVLVQSDSASGTADKSADGQVELIILGASLVQPSE